MMFTKNKISNEIRTLFFWQCVISEFISSAWYSCVFSSLLLNEKQEKYTWQKTIYTIYSAMTLGFSVTAISYMFQIDRGGLINPAGTIGHFLSSRISLLKTIMFVVVQMGGGIAGCAVIHGLTDKENWTSFSFPRLNIDNSHAAIIEGLMTFVIVMVTLAATDKKRNETNGSILFGSAVLAMYLFGSRFTGSITNPAVIFGAAVVLNKWPNYTWIYWVGPLTGGLLAGVCYSGLFSICAPKTSAYKQSLFSNEEKPPPQCTRENDFYTQQQMVDLAANDVVIANTNL